MNKKFKQHDFGHREQSLSDRIRTEASNLADILNELTDSREASLAMTKLEECVMWADKALTLYGAGKC